MEEKPVQPEPVEPKAKCPVELKPMAEWVGENDPKVCRSCLLAPVVQWYADELRESGQAKTADALIEKAEADEPLTLCQELDNIKNSVEEKLRERLKDFDCAIQSYKEDDEETILTGGQPNG